jgi:SOS response regulatory protein OraA/RecX
MNDDARNIVLRLQTRGDHSEAEVRRQLENRGFSAREIEVAIAWGRDNAALSDPRTAERTIEKSVAKKRGALRVQADLERRGLPADFTPDAKAEQERAEAALATRLSQFAGDPLKAAAWLSRQGYDEETVRRVVEKLVGELPI